MQTTMPRQQTQLTDPQRRQLDKLLARYERAETARDAARAALDDFLKTPAVSIPAAARYMGLTPETLYQRVRGK